MRDSLCRASAVLGAILIVGPGSPSAARAQDRASSKPAAVQAFEAARELGAQIGLDRDEDPPGRERFLSSLTSSRLTDAGVARLRSIPPGEVPARDGSSPVKLAWPGLLNFQKLALADAPITDRGLAQLRGMENLEYLDLAGTKVTDPGVIGLLPTLPRLRVLILGDQREAPIGQVKYATAGITDRGLAAVGQSSKLQHLRLAGLPVTDAGLASLAGLKDLERLNLGGTRITDAGLVHVKAMPKLHDLRLASTKVTDAGLADLADHPQLLWLVLNRTAITDQGLAQLAKMPMMRVGERQDGKASTRGMILVFETRVTDDGLATLREQLPKVTISPERMVRQEAPARPPSTTQKTRPTRKGSAPMKSAPPKVADAKKAVAVPEKTEEPPFELKGAWDVTGPRLSRGYVIEFGANGSVTARHKFGVSRISSWSYGDGSIRFGGSIRVNDIRIQGPWKAHWNGEREIDVTDPDGQVLNLKRR